MTMVERMYSLRARNNLSQEKFAESIGVSRQAVQKWENDSSMPDVDNLQTIARKYAVSLDWLVSGRSGRDKEILQSMSLTPDYTAIPWFLDYSSDSQLEYRQCCEEGRPVQQYEPLFDAVSKLPAGAVREKMADALFELVMQTPVAPERAEAEPSALPEIHEQAAGFDALSLVRPDAATLADKIRGAWMGRICGCLLGKPVEGMRTPAIHTLLKGTGNWPLSRYMRADEISEELAAAAQISVAGHAFADCVDCAPVDDDTNYTVLAGELIERYGYDFEPKHVADLWMTLQPFSAYFTAERVAFRNFMAGYRPPVSAAYKNPYREWIGAQIRGDYFGYIHPCDPQAAADMAWRDASISHIKNGIYGEMWVAAMLACAAGCDDLLRILECGLSVIPQRSRLHEAVSGIIDGYRNGVSQEKAFADIHRRYDEFDGHHWCHTISNAMIVAASLLYGEGDYGRSICMAVQTGFDTDCNAATVGSILGMRGGCAAIGPEWQAPVKGKLRVAICERNIYTVDELVERTLRHIR